MNPWGALAYEATQAASRLILDAGPQGLVMAKTARALGVSPQALHQTCGSRAEFCLVVLEILAADWRHWLSAQFVERIAVLPDSEDEVGRVLVWHAAVEFAQGEARAGHRALAALLGSVDQFEHDELHRRIHIAQGRPPSQSGARGAVAMVRGLRREIVAGRLHPSDADRAFRAALGANLFRLIDVNQSPAVA